MSIRYDTSLISGAVVYGNPGLGVLGQAILDNTATGDNGPGYMHGLVKAGDGAKEFWAEIISWPVSGVLFADEYGRLDWDFAGLPNGAYSFTYRLKVDGVLIGTATVTTTTGPTSVAGSGTVSSKLVTATAAALAGSGGARAGVSSKLVTASAGQIEAAGVLSAVGAVVTGKLVTASAGSAGASGGARALAQGKLIAAVAGLVRASDGTPPRPDPNRTFVITASRVRVLNPPESY